MSLQTRLDALITAIGADIKALRMFTWATTGANVTIVNQKTVTFGAAGWGSGAYSVEGFIRGVWCSARVSPTIDHVMFGLNSDPATSGGYSDIDYAINVSSNTGIYIYENGEMVLNPGLSATVDDVLSITYDGINIRYWKNSTLLRTVARSMGIALHFDSSAAPSGGTVTLTDIHFGPIGENPISGSETVWVDSHNRPRFMKGILFDPANGSRTYSSNGVTLASLVSGTQEIVMIADDLQLVDQRVVGKITFLGSFAGGMTGAVLLKVRSTTAAILCYVDSANIYIFMGYNGAGGTLAGPIALSSALVIGTTYWVDSKIIGNVVTHKIFTSDPDIGSPTPLATATATLAGANATNVGANRHGSPGYRAVAIFSPAGSIRYADWRYTAL